MSIKWVADWHQAWRWTSVHAMSAAVAIQAAWMALPPGIQAQLNANDVRTLTIITLALGIVGRLRDQNLKPPLPKPTVPPSNDFHQRDP